MRSLLIATLLLSGSACLLPSQFPTDVAVGSRVRIVLPDSLRQAWGPRVQFLHGEVAALALDTMYLRVHATPSPLAVPRASIRRIERSLGVPSRVESGLRGALFGAFWLGAMALVGEDSIWNDEIAATTAGGAAIGFVLGAIFPTERWRHIRLR